MTTESHARPEATDQEATDPGATDPEATSAEASDQEATGPEDADQVLRTIQKVISEVARIEPAEIQLDSPVTGLRNVDSILLLEIVVRTENELDIEIDEQDLFDINTVRDFAAFCRRTAA